jgi:hypothetical protein
MHRFFWPLLLSLPLAGGGCLPEESQLAVVSGGLSDVAPPPPTGHLPQAPASEDAAKRVLQVGGQVLASNPKLGFHPVFTTIGRPWQEIFHQDDKAVFITEGLVRGCTTDGMLAAVLSHELGKMAAERRQRAGPPPDHGPPMDAPVGTDYAGAFGPPDGTRTMELAVYEHKRRKAADAAAAPADAEVLAKAILEKAGGTAADLDAAAPLLRDAEDHMMLEKQMGGK